MFKNNVEFFLKESVRSDKVSKFATPAKLYQLKNKFRGNKEAISFLSDLEKDMKEKFSKGVKPSELISKAFNSLEKDNPKLFELFASNVDEITITLGKHTPFTKEELEKRAKRQRYSEMETSGLKGEARDKLMKRAKREDESDFKKDKKAAEKWVEGEEVPTDKKEPLGFYGKKKVGITPKKIVDSKFESDFKRRVLAYAKMAK